MADRWYDKDCCFTCTSWCEGARRKMAAIIERWTEEGYDLDALDGVAEEGDCSEGIPGVNLEVHGNAYADITTDANFKCPTFAPKS
jgi:hypothetical protein